MVGGKVLGPVGGRSVVEVKVLDEFVKRCG